MPIYLPGETLPASKVQALGTAVQSFSPALTASTTNPTLGTGALQEGNWTRNGELCIGRAYIQFGTAGVAAGSGTYFVSAPVQIADTGMLKVIVGSGQVIDANTLDIRVANFYWLSGDTQRFRITVEGASDATNAQPWVWAANDQIAYEFSYPAVWP